MPADPTNAAQRDQQRRQSRRFQEEGGHAEGHGGHAREIELKRSRGEISCAECRRYRCLALRCFAL